MYAKNVGETKGLFFFSRNKRTIKKAAMKLDVFCIRYFSKMKRKPTEKYTEMFSYQSVAHMPKVRQNLSKKK